jgi:hypothetical protein
MPGTFFVMERPNVAGRPVRRLISPSSATSGCVRRSADLAEQRDLGLRAPTTLAVALAERSRRLEHAALTVAHHLRDREQLVRVRVRAGHDAPVRHPVQRGARGREPERAGVDRLGDEVAHGFDVR